MKEVGRMKTKELNKGEIIITSQDLHKPIYEFFKRISGICQHGQRNGLG